MRDDGRLYVGHHLPHHKRALLITIVVVSDELLILFVVVVDDEVGCRGDEGRRRCRYVAISRPASNMQVKSSCCGLSRK